MSTATPARARCGVVDSAALRGYVSDRPGLALRDDVPRARRRFKCHRGLPWRAHHVDPRSRPLGLVLVLLLLNPERLALENVVPRAGRRFKPRGDLPIGTVQCSTRTTDPCGLAGVSTGATPVGRGRGCGCRAGHGQSIAAGASSNESRSSPPALPPHTTCVQIRRCCVFGLQRAPVGPKGAL